MPLMLRMSRPQRFPGTHCGCLPARRGSGPRTTAARSVRPRSRRVRLFLAGNHLEQGRLTGTVGADDADDGARRHDHRQVVDQQAVAELLGHVLELHHRVAQAFARRDEDLVGFVALLVIDRLQLFQAGQTCLALGAAALGVLARPFQFLLDRLLAGLLLVVFLLEALVLLGQPVGVVALPRNAAAAVSSRIHSAALSRK